MIVPRVFKSRQRKRKNISIVLSSQSLTIAYTMVRLFLFFIFYEFFDDCKDNHTY
jgi:hypothetical protein